MGKYIKVGYVLTTIKGLEFEKNIYSASVELFWNQVPVEGYTRAYNWHYILIFFLVKSMP